MGIFWSSASASEPTSGSLDLPHVENHELSWKQHPEIVREVERLRRESPAFAKLSDEQIGNGILIAEACRDKGEDARKLSEVSIVTAQAESSLRNISTKHPRSSAFGLFQQTEQFAQRDAKGHWTEKLSKETRCNPKDCVDRSYRILNKEQHGDNDWKKKNIKEACFKLQRCEPKHKDIYSDPERKECARVISDLYYPDQESMIRESSRVGSQRTQGHQTSMTFDRGPPQQRYTGRVDPHSVVDAFKARGMDSSLGNRAKVAEQLNIPGTPGTADHNTSLLRALG